MGQVSTKKTVIILAILFLLVALSCNHPDVYKMVYDYYYGPQDTATAKSRQYELTDRARRLTNISAEQTKNAEVNNRLSTQNAIQGTQNAINSTQTKISFNSTNIAWAKESTAYVLTLGADPRSPVIDSIRFPTEFYTGEPVTGYVVFHDYNGDVRRLRIDAVKAIGWTPIEITPDNRIVSGDRFNGTIEFSFT